MDKRQPMRASATFAGQPVHRQYPDGKSSLEIPRPNLGPFLILLAQLERAGQACEAPDVSSILAEDAITFG